MIREGAKLSGRGWEVGDWRTIKQPTAPHTPQSGRNPEVGTIQLLKRNGCTESSLDRSRTRLSPGLLPHPLVTQTLGAALF